MKLTLFDSVQKAYVTDDFEGTWSEVVEVLSLHCPATVKDDVPLYNFVEFKTLDDPTVDPARKYHGKMINGDWVRDASGKFDPIPNTVRRCKENVLGLWGILLDFDGGKTVDEVIAEYQGLEFFLYTTFRHLVPNPDTGVIKEKFRVVIPFNRMLDIKDVAGRKESIKQSFPAVDAASFSESQSFYFHSGVNPRVYHSPGIMIDPYKHFMERAVTVYTPPDADAPAESNDWTAEDQQTYKQAVLKSLMSCSNLHYRSDHSDYGICVLVNICKSIGLTYEEYSVVVDQIGAGDSTLNSESIRRSPWTSWAGNKATKATRDKFIRDHNGIPFEMPKQARQQGRDALSAKIFQLAQKQFKVGENK